MVCERIKIITSIIAHGTAAPGLAIPIASAALERNEQMGSTNTPMIAQCERNKPKKAKKKKKTAIKKNTSRIKEFSIWFIRLIAFPISSTWMNFALNLDSITKSLSLSLACSLARTEKRRFFSVRGLDENEISCYITCVFISLPSIYRVFPVRISIISGRPTLRTANEICALIRRATIIAALAFAHEYWWHCFWCRQNVPVAQFNSELNTDCGREWVSASAEQTQSNEKKMPLSNQIIVESHNGWSAFLVRQFFPFYSFQNYSSHWYGVPSFYTPAQFLLS